MIIEIIVILCFLGSLIGIILAVRHYFKHWKAKSDNKKMLMAIECAEDENARYDKFYENILDKIDGRAIAMFIGISLIAVMLFWVFASPNKEVSTGNEGKPVQPAGITLEGGGGGVSNTENISINDSGNFSMLDLVPKFLKDSKGGLSFWFFILAGGIMFWIMSRIIRNHSYL